MRYKHREDVIKYHIENVNFIQWYKLGILYTTLGGCLQELNVRIQSTDFIVIKT